MGTVNWIDQVNVCVLLTSLKHKVGLADERMTKKIHPILQQALITIQNDNAYRRLLTELLEHEKALLQHSFHVTIYSLAIALKINMKAEELQQLALAALLHDIGKIAIRPAVLNKPGKLTSKEYEEVKTHTVWGLRYLQAYASFPRAIQEVVVQHHERLDGSGYPYHLTAECIHPWAKIVAVSDVFDALTAKRCYKQAMSPLDALQVLKKEAAIKLDATYVALLASCITTSTTINPQN